MNNKIMILMMVEEGKDLFNFYEEANRLLPYIYNKWAYMELSITMDFTLFQMEQIRKKIWGYECD